MNLQRSTRYGLYAAAELARAADGEPTTVARVADGYGIPEPALAKAFQRLVRAGIATGTRGVGGGYALARSPAEVTLLEVVESFETVGSPGTCLLAGGAARCCARPADCALRQVFDEVDGLTRTTLAAISLATLVRPRRRSAAGGTG